MIPMHCGKYWSKQRDGLIEVISCIVLADEMSLCVGTVYELQGYFLKKIEKWQVYLMSQDLRCGI